MSRIAIFDEAFFRDYDASIHANRAPYYQALVDEAPVYRRPNTNSWIVSGHEEASLVLKHPAMIREWTRLQDEPPSEPPADENPMNRMFSKMMLFRDPPAHTRLRNLVNKAFTPRMIESLRPRVSDIANSLLNEMIGEERFEFISQFAFPLPVLVIAELLGVPKSDRAQFRTWSTTVTKALDFGSATDEERSQIQRCAREMMAYFSQLADERHGKPQNDLISGLVRVSDEGDLLTREELIATCILLLVAGHETTVNLLGNTVALFLRNPAARDWLRSHPDGAAAAVEEVLRYESPVQLTTRLAAEPVTVGGKTIERGQDLVILIAAANRDRRVFDKPDAFDPGRNPNRHIAFGFGPHFCLGAPLARLEGEVAMELLSRHWNDWAMDGDDLLWRPSIIFRGPYSLPLQTTGR